MSQLAIQLLVAERAKIDQALTALTGGPRRRGRPPKDPIEFLMKKAAMPSLTVNGKRRGRPPGVKNKAA